MRGSLAPFSGPVHAMLGGLHHHYGPGLGFRSHRASRPAWRPGSDGVEPQPRLGRMKARIIISAQPHAVRTDDFIDSIDP
jgi:hypothetical protein